MGSPAEEKQKLIEKMNQTLNDIEMRRLELNVNLDMEQDENQAVEIKKELTKLESQATAVKGARDEFEQQYAKLKTDEERKKLERIVKMAIIVGITSESIRLAWEKERQLEADKESVRQEREALRKERFEKAVERIFETMTLKYVTREMINEIKDNKKFKEMAESDPDRLNREEMVKKDEYTSMMARTFARHRMSLTGNFNKDQEQLKKAYKDETGYEKALPKMKKFIEGDLQKYGTEEEKKLFGEIYKDMLEISVITRKVRNEFVAGESDFFKGNGFTKEIYDKEQSIYKRLYDHKEKVNQENLAYAEKGEMDKVAERMNIYMPTVTFEGDIKPTVEEDADQFNNNEFRKETEMWKVYQKLPGDSVEPVVHVSAKAKNEVRAWSKIQRMSKMAMVEGKGSFTSCMYEWARNKAHDTLKTVMDKKNLNAEDKAQLKENFAAIVFNQLVYNEQKSADIEKPLSKVLLKKYKKHAEMELICKKFAASPEFNQVFNQYIKGGDYKDKCIRFLSEDVEQQMVLQLAGAKNEIIEAITKKETDFSRSKSVRVSRNETIKSTSKNNKANHSKGKNNPRKSTVRHEVDTNKERVRSQSIMPS